MMKEEDTQLIHFHFVETPFIRLCSDPDRPSLSLSCLCFQAEEAMPRVSANLDVYNQLSPSRVFFHLAVEKTDAL